MYMKDVAVAIKGDDEYAEFVALANTLGAREFYSEPGSSIHSEKFCMWIEGVKIRWSLRDSGKITLTEFKKEQGIMSMKYSVGDVLENDVDCTLTIEGIIGRVYIGIDHDDDGVVYSESELEDYTLKTDEPELVTLTMEDIAKREGIPVERLRIKD